MLFPGDKLVVFAKAPIPGQVKKRLIPALGAEGTARLHQEMLEQKLRIAHDHYIADVELYCWPDTRHPYFQHAQSRYRIQLHPQQGDDLGERMANAMQGYVKDNHNTVLIGTDCPPLDGAYITQAFHALQAGADAVIGPAEDGGYILIGLSRFNSRIFKDIHWGGKDVLSQTLSRLKQLNLDYVVLDTLWDVDRPEDLVRLGDFYN